MIKIKFLLGICFCITFSAHIRAQEAPFKGRLYIVRHAEKDTGTNPILSAAGQKRAGDLYRQLKDKKIDLILVSQFRRTAMTADSLRLQNKIETLQYKADATGESLFQVIAANGANAKNILVVGHSNTLPVIIKKAGVKDYPQTDIPDYEYDNLFIVEQSKKGPVVLAIKYGAKSVLQGPATQMKISQ
jgi:phosphohistidine phosphatase SixA